MANQGDLKELLMMFTSRKVPMMAAMGHVKTLQAKSLRSIEDIAKAPLATVQEALTDPKLAKSFHTACKSHLKTPAKRPLDASSSVSPDAKKPKLEPHKRDLDYGSLTPDELEASLDLPLVRDEALIRETGVMTNRAPLLLAFAVEALRVTMPGQPPSSRLSLAQGVVSANSRSKAVSLGLEKAGSGGDGISEGQPKVRVLGREVPVLKRGGYVWTDKEAEESSTASSSTMATTITAPTKTWTASQKLTSRSSTFIAHAAPLSSPSQRSELIKSLMASKPDLETATHNAWAVRTRYGGSPLVQEASFDDGETGCGKFLLQVLREADAGNAVVVLTRWYGGVMLGPDRWRLMRECVNGALASQGRTASLGSGEAVWALDPEDKRPAASTVGMAIHRPEGARNYLLRTFVSATAPRDKDKDKDGDRAGAGGDKKKPQSVAAANEEKQENLGRLLGALRLLFESWKGVLGREELDRRAWSWYVAVRPDVEAGPGGWGAKGTVRLARILDLRRKETTGTAGEV